jgi:hypothetical protein
MHVETLPCPMQTFKPHKEKQGLTKAVSPELRTKKRALTVRAGHGMSACRILGSPLRTLPTPSALAGCMQYMKACNIGLCEVDCRSLSDG